jgi:hypothetical protein
MPSVVKLNVVAFPNNLTWYILKDTFFAVRQSGTLTKCPSTRIVKKIIKIQDIFLFLKIALKDWQKK